MSLNNNTCKEQYAEPTNITSFRFQIWDRVLQQDEIVRLSRCNASIPNGKVVTWSGSEKLWNLSNITIEKFEKGADKTLCGKTGCLVIK